MNYFDGDYYQVFCCQQFYIARPTVNAIRYLTIPPNVSAKLFFNHISEYFQTPFVLYPMRGYKGQQFRTRTPEPQGRCQTSVLPLTF